MMAEVMDAAGAAGAGPLQALTREDLKLLLS